MNLSNITWDVEHCGSWPTPIKAAIIAFLCLVLMGAWYYFDTEAQLTELDTAKNEEVTLRGDFEQKYRKAASLDAYKIQLAEMEKTFGDLLRQLPDKTQVPELLVDVSQTGLASGLEFELFKPGAEVVKDFYAELPIEVQVVGNYMDFGTFVSGLASLPRIVTVHNIKLAPTVKGSTTTTAASSGQKVRKFPMRMNALVKTYRYLEEGVANSEESGGPPKKGASKGGKKPEKATKS